MNINIESLQPADWEDVIRIYKEGIASVNATFETEVPDWKSWDVNHFPTCRIVAKSGIKIVGWAALCPISKREVYSGVAEVSIYVAISTQGQGIGKALLRKLVNLSENEGIWTLQAGIFSENNISISLHKSCGFREVGFREKIGKMNGKWRDVVLMERRSNLIGK